MIRRRTAAALVALLAALALSTAHVVPASAQDGGNGKREKKEEREKTAEEKELEKIGKEFAAGDVDALIARIPEKNDKGKEGKVKLNVGDSDGRFNRTQARGILDKWFADRVITKVELKSTKDLVGTFTLKFRPRGEGGERERTLVIHIARDGDDGFVLKEIEVQVQ